VKRENSNRKGNELPLVTMAVINKVTKQSLGELFYYFCKGKKIWHGWERHVLSSYIPCLCLAAITIQMACIIL